MAAPTRFEDRVKWRFTRCLNDVVIKGIAATALSILGTKMFFKKRVSTRGATLAGFGVAIGMSYQNCEREMQLALTTPCEKSRRKKEKGEDDCLELEKGDKKPENMSSDQGDQGKPPEGLQNEDKNKKKPEDLKNEKAKKAADPKTEKAKDLKNDNSKKATELKNDKNKKSDEGKVQKPDETKNVEKNKSEVDKVGK
uniref:MICOS complex subunit MIC10 n=1 Tax=Lygus hesperus TaxID=30085 RepID=A0A0A9Y2Z3_LYGHE